MAGKLDGLGELGSWASVPDYFKNRHAALVLGNGASRSVWDDFKYDSLYGKACDVPVGPLSVESKKLFDYLKTTNFEQVLGLVTGADAVVSGLGMAHKGEIQACYQNVKEALIEAVHAVHLPWTEGLVANLEAIRSALQSYHAVFTTNYDLIPYWALMTGDGTNVFKDSFVNGAFVEYGAGNRIPVYYLHGALHLYRTIDHQTRKHENIDGHNLLDLFAESFRGGNRPLFVSEGTSADKLRSINDSDYLSFAFEKLENHSGRLVVFGHGLDPDVDQHLVNALRPNRKREAAISIYPPGTPEKIAKLQVDLVNRLPDWQITFFDMTTHPLGEPRRKVTPAQRGP